MAHPDARPGTSSGLRRGPPLRPQISSCQDVTWGGEKMIEISFDPATLPLGPKSLLAYFPEGRATLTTQALVSVALCWDVYFILIYCRLECRKRLGVQVWLSQKYTGLWTIACRLT
ncbi:hypothetical protein PLICRDRAFT_33745 [Plicaturopsis crispa FD-325 SS-3]|nr:hypothetical protein PLICRDRAFT_33745 [Plicaturopsis crispa FD-325 SS-3]